MEKPEMKLPEMKLITFREAKRLMGKNNPLQGDYGNDDFDDLDDLLNEDLLSEELFEELKRRVPKDSPLYGLLKNKEMLKKAIKELWSETTGEQEGTVLWHEGGKLKGDIDLDGVEGVLVTGDLDLDGSIANTSDGAFIVITGSLKARNLIAGDAQIYIMGDATIENAILGHYNDGILFIGGKTKARAILNQMHDCTFRGGSEGIKIALDSDKYFHETYFNPDFYHEDLPNVLRNEFFDAEGHADERRLMEAILAGKEFLKKDALTSNEKAAALVRELVQQGATEIDLSGKHLSDFPKELTSLTSLRSLDLSGNLLESLPAEIAKLGTSLRSLDLSHNRLKSLPPEIAQLRHLEVLDISENWIDSLPKEFSQLKSLRKLIAWRGFETFPEVIGELENLEELEIGSLFDSVGDERRLAEFPLAVTKLRKLRKLDVSHNAFQAIPEEILDLENLEELNLDSSLSHIKAIPDFSRLKKLKTLRFNGLQKYTTEPFPTHELMAQVFRATSLEHLYIDRWGEGKEEDEETGKKFVRPPLHTIPEAIGDLVHLRTLDVSFNNITHFPESFFRLTKLETVDLQSNEEMSWEEFQKLARRMPNTEFIVDRSLREDERDENWQKVHELVKGAAADLQEAEKADNAQKSVKARKAVRAFADAIALCVPDKKWDEYDCLYAHYGRMKGLNLLVLSQDGDEKARVVAEIEATSHACLALVREQANPMYYSQESDFQREITRQACDSLAWFLQERTGKSDAETLGQALHYADQGIAAADHIDKGLYLWDTKVRILLKLDRVDEAYAIVQRILQENQSFKALQDIKDSAPYQAWLKKS